ncbi:16204_t:CDS:1, partial [Cetraspora pellucida]
NMLRTKVIKRNNIAILQNHILRLMSEEEVKERELKLQKAKKIIQVIQDDNKEK